MLKQVESKILEIRGQKVILDFELSEMYQVENRVLKQAVKRNIDRFPLDFMFQLSKNEWNEVITKCDNLPVGIKFSPVPPLAFTEQGVAMLSSILKSKKALQVNIAIMRAFVFIRKYALSHKELTEKLKELETKYNKQFEDIYQAINFLIQKDNQENTPKDRKRIGFKNE
ncbi:MAG: DNA-binding protein [Bacteroidetes bacterium GWF2_38_335]|nr:MAG: DNA-binding protein [Bacteroidetes bacterium GWF2_38_335]OFY81974.1 MAG: DNA-binding protein [Bacteroidetes bacterium RIFOXYA12_FULL_38_20]HBS86528.1 DNA-binding protein [Bacteroidales bacterium]